MTDKTETDHFQADVVVIGAGVVGLAIAQKIARQGREVLLLEAANAIGTETSSRNSEVIHAGLYYTPGSLKARFCVQGRRAIYAHAETYGVAVKKCGKLVVALGDAEAEGMQALYERSLENDVENLHLIDGDAARAIEPALSPVVSLALHAEESGIFDSHGFMLSLQGLLEDAGGMLATHSKVVSGEVRKDGILLSVETEEGLSEIEAQLVINSAGHGAIPLAASIEGPHRADLPRNYWVKGSYFTVSGKTPFSRLIYPMHSSTSLGLHLTVDMGGRGKLGPDAEWLPDDAKPPFDYRVDPARAEIFYETVRRYWPGLPDDALAPDYSGVRPKIVGPGKPSADFKIEGPASHGSAGLINLFGIESPGLTSSLAIADHVSEIVANET